MDAGTSFEKRSGDVIIEILESPSTGEFQVTMGKWDETQVIRGGG
jgi:hypothetical protein